MVKKKINISPLDVLIGLILICGCIYMAYRIQVGLQYNWNWQAIPQYLFRYDIQQEKWVLNLLAQGLLTTIRLSFWGTILACLFGTIMGLCRVSKSLFKRLLGQTYVELCRNLPPLVIIFIFYFFVSDQILPLLGVDQFIRSQSESIQRICGFFLASPDMFSIFLSGVITLALFEGAYIAEIVRAGIQSIEREQWEAANALGMSRRQTMQHVIMPQAIQRILPPLAGQFISTIKDSAIVSVISIQELTFQGMEIMAATYMTFEIWITISLLYLSLTLSCSMVVSRLEARLNKNPLPV